MKLHPKTNGQPDKGRENNASALEERRYVTDAMRHFRNVMLWEDEQTVGSWADKLLSELLPFVEGAMATMYGFYKEKLRLLAIFGAETDQVRPTYDSSEGLLGKVFLHRQPLFLTRTQHERLTLPFGTGFLKSEALLLLPLSYNSRSIGVLEIVFFKEPSEEVVFLLEKIAREAGGHLNALLKELALRESMQKTKENEERLKVLAKAATEGIIFLEGRQISDANDAFLKMFGYVLQEVIGEDYARFLVADSCQSLFELDSQTIPKECVGRYANGTNFPIEVQMRNLFYQKRTYRVLTVRDITEKKLAEETLKDSREKLAEAQKIVELSKEIEKKNRKITDSINYAYKIQNAILPKEADFARILPQSFVYYQCKDIVSGDFYWLSENENHIHLAAVDCTGHGVPGAFMSFIGHSLLNTLINVRQISEPAQILTRLDNKVIKTLRQDEDTSIRDGMDLGLICIDKKTQKITFAGAHRPLWLVRKGKLEEYRGTRAPIGGVYSKPKTFQQVEIEPQKGDMLFLFSDGATDLFNPKGEKFKTKRLRQLLVEVANLPQNQQVETIKTAFQDWSQGVEFIDDVIILGLRL
ncbi:SpoIIE family protein phosphatase [Hugenholtzia roseola]|uniref:SpoIIE family protein phosphatase n=1 Tax=Hugenholtzia roseola TaxID=1002 RepID=UPI00047B508C|nr:SpoIIE family protein phosphatase [Hugenholtzia roseola]